MNVTIQTTQTNTLTQGQQAGIGIGASFVLLLCCGSCIGFQRRRKEPELVPVPEPPQPVERRKSVIEERRGSVILREVSIKLNTKQEQVQNRQDVQLSLG